MSPLYPSGEKERKNTLTKPMYFKTDSKVSKMWFHSLNTISKPLYLPVI